MGRTGRPRPVRQGGDEVGDGATSRLTAALAVVDQYLPGPSVRFWWDRWRSMFWVVPSFCVVASIGLAIGLVLLDHRLGRVQDAFLYPGPPTGARTLLSSIVTAMITFTGMVFSVSIVVLQLANGQFSSRVIRIYLRDLTVQVTLGLCLASFVYAMVVLRAVRGGEGQAHFVPRVAVTMSLVLVVATLGVFIGYINRISNLVRVATIVRHVGDEAHQRLEVRCPPRDRPHAPAGPLPPPVRTIGSTRAGVLVSVNEDRLVELAVERGCIVRVRHRVGDFVATGAPLCEVLCQPGPDGAGGESGGDGGGGGTWDDFEAQVHRAVALDIERTMEQDLAFGIRQLVDIAERALSPSVNDPTTASQCLDVLHDLLRRLAGRVLPDGVHRDHDGHVRLLVPQYGFADYLDAALVEIWHYGSGAAQVPERIRALVDDVAAVARPEHLPALRRWQDLLSDAEAQAEGASRP